MGLLEKFPDSSQESDDADHDGMTNLAEMLAGTDPTRVESVMRFENTPRSADLADGDKTPVGTSLCAIYFQTVPGKKYEIQRLDDFRGSWLTETVVTATTTQKRILVNKTYKQRFYRLLLVQ